MSDSNIRPSYRVSIDRNRLLSERPEFGYVDPLRSKYDRDNVGYTVPLHSRRIQVEHDRQPYYMLHPSSQDRMRKAVESHVTTRYNRVEKIIKVQLLRSKLSKWQQITCNQKQEITSVRKLMPELMQLTLPEDWFYRKGLQVLYTYLWYAQHRQLKTRFRRWKYMIDASRTLLARMFARWRWKASAWILAKMKARKFIQLTAGLASAVASAHLAHYYYRWQLYDLKMIMRIKLKLLFRCWKTAVQSIVQRRKRAVRSTFHSFQYGVQLTKRKVDRIMNNRRLKTLRKLMHHWLQLLRKKIVLRRILGSKLMLARGWNTWKGKQGHVAPRMRAPMSPPHPSAEPHQVLQTSYRAVYQSGSDQLVYRKVTTIARTPPQRARPPRTPPSTIPNLSTWRERFEWRLNVVKDLEKSVIEQELEMKPLWEHPPPPHYPPPSSAEYSFSQATPILSRQSPSTSFTPLRSSSASKKKSNGAAEAEKPLSRWWSPPVPPTPSSARSTRRGAESTSKTPSARSPHLTPSTPRGGSRSAGRALNTPARSSSKKSGRPEWVD